MSFCVNCGKETGVGDNFCIECGTPTGKRDSYTQDKNVETSPSIKNKKLFKRSDFLDNLFTNVNDLVWVLAFAPLIGMALEFMVMFCVGVSGVSMWYITLILNVVICGFDLYLLKRDELDVSGIEKIFIFIPVYLYKRAKLLDETKAYVVVWCVNFLLVIGAEQIARNVVFYSLW